ncbi:MAG: hypothetical protein AB7P34_15570 [Vicinamibacterales bacterium]
MLAGLLLSAPTQSSAQEGNAQPSASAASSGGKTMTARTASGATYTVTTQEKPAAKPRAEPEPPPRDWVRALTNVQVELTITDQSGTGTPEKKTVSMVVSSGYWGRIRSAGRAIRPGEGPVVVDLNVDARPLVAVDGPIQLELTIAYSPLGSPSPDSSQGKPPTVNQSLTVVLHSGKPMVISQAADPVGDRKITVEAKATVLK